MSFRRILGFKICKVQNIIGVVTADKYIALGVYVPKTYVCKGCYNVKLIFQQLPIQ